MLNSSKSFKVDQLRQHARRLKTATRYRDAAEAELTAHPNDLQLTTLVKMMRALMAQGSGPAIAEA